MDNAIKPIRKIVSQEGKRKLAKGEGAKNTTFMAICLASGIFYVRYNFFM
jgi:hypothetical protein